MSQLRVPPSARSRPTSDFAHGKKDCISQKGSNTSACMKAVGAHNLQPKVLEDAQQVEMNIESPHNGNMVNVTMSPTMHTHVHGHLKATHLPLKVISSSPLPLFAKHATVESFLDACYFCKRPLGHGRDIFMYRGDAAFCTEECRLRQISCDEHRPKCSVSASQSTTSDNTIANSKSAHITAPTGAF